MIGADNKPKFKENFLYTKKMNLLFLPTRGGNIHEDVKIHVPEAFIRGSYLRSSWLNKPCNRSCKYHSPYTWVDTLLHWQWYLYKNAGTQSLVITRFKNNHSWHRKISKHICLQPPLSLILVLFKRSLFWSRSNRKSDEHFTNITILSMNLGTHHYFVIKFAFDH